MNSPLLRARPIYLLAGLALIGAVLTWLASSDDALSLGIDIKAQELALERGLYPEWTGNAHAKRA